MVFNNVRRCKVKKIISLILVVCTALCVVSFASCKQNEPEPESPKAEIYLSQTELTIVEDDTATLVATVKNTSESVRWSSDNTNVASVSNGVVLAKNQGSATITASVADVHIACKVTVSAAAVTPDYYITFEDGARYMAVGESGTVSAKLYMLVNDSGVEQQADVTYSSGDENILSVDSATGRLTANGAGTVLITATAGDASKSVTFEVYDEYVSNADEWLAMFAKHDKRFLVVNDIDFADVGYTGFCDLTWVDDNANPDAMFTNDVNGGNHTVKNIRLENTDGSKVCSVFGYVKESKIENINFENVVFTGQYAAAGLAQRMIGADNLVSNVVLDLHFEQPVVDVCSGVVRYMYGGAYKNILVKIDSPSVPDGEKQYIDGVCSTSFTFSGAAQLSNIVVYTQNTEIVPCRISIEDGKTYAKLPDILNNSVVTFSGKMDVAQFLWGRLDRNVWDLSVNDIPSLKKP